MASTSTPQRASETHSICCTSTLEILPASDCGAVPSSAKAFVHTWLRITQAQVKPPHACQSIQETTTDDIKPSTPGEFAIPRPPKMVSKCLFEDVEMDADGSGFGASPAMKLNTNHRLPPRQMHRAPPIFPHLS
ncbi:hypothetical protein RHS01_01730 [Rhizoctonia solani]|uniref:Uncharacterized protein n=1 Tax=Rhizoctonia solani TaxID=456999 RepID=A0A8H7IK84_9AGAM|nr:hypothetical protein RHS01_01730 [Rhizoctonia solani]